MIIAIIAMESAANYLHHHHNPSKDFTILSLLLSCLLFAFSFHLTKN